MFTCHSCGANVRFSPEKQKLVCDFCGNEYTTKEYNEQAALGAEAHDDATYAVTVFTCPQCGGEIMTQDDTATTFCSYCGSSVMLDRVIREEMKPDYVIPFKITKEECEKKYRELITKSRYLPRQMKDDNHISQFRAIYMPFWVYDSYIDDFTVHWQYPPNAKYDHLISEKFNVKVSTDGYVRGADYDASSTFADQLSGAIGPYYLKERVDFHPSYLSGFYADSNDLDASVYEKIAENETIEKVWGELEHNPSFSSFHITSEALKNTHGVIHKRKPQLAFYPVWFLASKSRNGKKVSYAVVNGQTGKGAADLPIDFGKYLLSSLLIALPIFLIFNLLLTLTPAKTVIASIIMAIAGIRIAKIDEKKVRDRNLGRDDVGRTHKEKQNGTYKGYSGGNKKNIKALLPILGIILGIIVLIINPARDIIFYGVAALISFLVVLTFLGIVLDYNKLSTRKMPQLGKRGGEEHV